MRRRCGIDSKKTSKYLISNAYYAELGAHGREPMARMRATPTGTEIGPSASDKSWTSQSPAPTYTNPTEHLDNLGQGRLLAT